MTTSNSITSATPDTLDPAKLMSKYVKKSLIKVVRGGFELTKIDMTTSNSITSATPDSLDPAKLMSKYDKKSLIKVVSCGFKLTKIDMTNSNSERTEQLFESLSSGGRASHTFAPAFALKNFFIREIIREEELSQEQLPSSL
jgi:hypothetical protein